MRKLNNDWDALLADEFQKNYIKQLAVFLTDEYDKCTVYPMKKELLHALELTPYKDVKVVILGQDPYHQPGQAQGLAFSVRDGFPIPPSLQNIYKEIEATIGTKRPSSGNLTRWAEQGVLLLNTVLSVRQNQAGSHRGHGWEQLTDYIISLLNEREDSIIFILWGADAKKKVPLITNNRHSILTASHPSPLSAYNGFFGCDHFRKTNEILRDSGKNEIVW